tara:strand:+ start:785 stop:991 length:207 start_codon:yes stop_codon:yes gene_type:complete
MIELLIKSFESKTKKPEDRYAEFLYHCYYSFDKIKKSKNMLNKYISDRDSLVKYIIANKESITLELTR